MCLLTMGSSSSSRRSGLAELQSYDADEFARAATIPGTQDALQKKCTRAALHRRRQQAAAAADPKVAASPEVNLAPMQVWFAQTLLETKHHLATNAGLQNKKCSDASGLRFPKQRQALFKERDARAARAAL